MKKLVVVRLTTRNGLAPNEILNEHYQFLMNHDAVYFSTNIPASSDRFLDKLVFVLSYKGKWTCVSSDIVRYQAERNQFIPEDVNLYSPKLYRNEPKKVWYLLKNMKIESESFAEKCLIEYSDGHSEKLSDLYSRPKWNKVFATISDENDSVFTKLLP